MVVAAVVLMLLHQPEPSPTSTRKALSTPETSLSGGAPGALVALRAPRTTLQQRPLQGLLSASWPTDTL